jgi:hypothetical protein
MRQQTPLGQDLLIIEDSRSKSVRHTTLGRTPLDEWSARRKDLYLTTHSTHNRKISMPPVKFEPTIPASERPQTHALDRATTETGKWRILNRILLVIISNFWCFFHSNRFSKTAIWKLWHIGTTCIFVADKVVIFSELPYCASCLIIERCGGWTLCKLGAIIMICAVRLILYLLLPCEADQCIADRDMPAWHDSKLIFSLLLPCLLRSQLFTISWRYRRHVLTL